MTDNLTLLKELEKAPEENESLLIGQNMGLVKAVAKRFSFSGTEFEDLVQIGTIGLLKAIRNFDPSRGLALSTYAVPVIAGEIKKYLRDNGAVKVSRTLREQFLKLQRAKEKLSKKLERSPTVSELSEETGIPVEEIPLVSDAGSVPCSFDDPIGSDGKTTVADTVKAKDGNDLENFALKEIINTLPPQERKIITLRYFLEKTQQETAVILGTSQVQISRKEKKILAEIREKLSG